MNTMTYGDYVARVEYDEEDRLFRGTVINLSSVVTFAGESVEELEQEFTLSVDTYLEVCKERGLEPEKPFSGNLMLRMGPDIHRQAALASDIEGKSLNSWIRDTVVEAAREILETGGRKVYAVRGKVAVSPEPLGMRAHAKSSGYEVIGRKGGGKEKVIRGSDGRPASGKPRSGEQRLAARKRGKDAVA